VTTAGFGVVWAGVIAMKVHWPALTWASVHCAPAEIRTWMTSWGKVQSTVKVKFPVWVVETE
jgi:hypothetical protein